MSGISDLVIEPIDLDNRKELKRFMNVHYEIYRDDKYWVAPLEIDFLEQFNRRKNPYFAYGQVQPFIVLRENAAIGRIVAYAHTLGTDGNDEHTGFFGYFECADDVEAARALITTAAGWLQKIGCTEMRGPVTFSAYGKSTGLLVSGFEATPLTGTVYNLSYYQALMERSGLRKKQDLHAYYLEVPAEVPEKVRRVAERVYRNPRLLIRRLRMKSYAEEVEHLKAMYRQWDLRYRGTVPMSDDEFIRFSEELKYVFDPHLTFIAEYDSAPVGFSTVIIDVNRALKDARGKMLPLGLPRVLLKKRNISWGRVPMIGILESHRGRGIDAALYFKSLVEGYKRGYRHVELSPIPEHDTSARNMLQNLDLQIYKTYRVFGQKLS